MTDDLANAGAAGGAAPSEPSISGAGNEAAPATVTSEPRGIRGSFEAAKATLEGIAPQDGAQPQGQPKGPDGRFAMDPAKAAQAALEASAAALKAPERWEQGWKESFEKAPPEVQKLWLDQHKAWETGYNKKFEELAGQRKFADEMRTAIPQEMAARIQAKGMSPAQAVQKLFQFQQMYETDPVGYVAQIMRAKGIDPRIFLQQQGPNGQQQASPAQQLAPIVQPLLDKIARLEQGQQSWNQHQEAEHRKAVEAGVNSFVQETDAGGALKFPYLAKGNPHEQRIGARMAQIIASDPRFAEMDARSRLEEAYQIAVLGDKDIRDEIVTAEASRRAEAMERERLNNRARSSATAKPSATMSASAPPASGRRAAFEAAKKQLGAA